jgi:hypothetical protein
MNPVPGSATHVEANGSAVFTIIGEGSERDGDPILLRIGTSVSQNAPYPLPERNLSSGGTYSISGAATAPGEYLVRIGDQIAVQADVSASITAPDPIFPIGFGPLAWASVSVSLELAPPPPTDIAPTSLSWDAINGGVDIAYTISGSDSPRAPRFKFYWANGTSMDTVISEIPGVLTGATAASGSPYRVDLPASFFNAPPASATHLLVKADFDGQITDSLTTRVSRSRT